jgi:REP element-mobilizing transposase RayT
MAKRFNAPDNPNVLHYVTLNVRDKRQAFRKEVYAALALRQLRDSCDSHPAEITAYVVMPDHLHFIVRLADGKIGRFLSHYKSEVTIHMLGIAQREGHVKRLLWLKAKGQNELWQESKHSLHLWSGYMIRQKIRYIHDNPVRAELVEKPQDYLWSSIAAYIDGERQPPVKVDTVW